ncbi:MAG: response regulator [Anaerolineaceae bacterium]|nr:response regulator [Anaerolineaceae bacterium]
MTRIRIMIVDDQDVVRRGLNLFFASIDEIELVAEAANGVEAVQLCDEIVPDVILMDLMMPEMDGVAATTIIRQKHPQIQVIALTSAYDDATLRHMLDAGASGYLLKNASVDELKKTILAAGKGS